MKSKRYLKEILTLVVCVSSLLVCEAQTTETTYYKSRMDRKVVPKEKASYSESVTRFEDGSIVKQQEEFKKDRVVYREIWKGDEPVGVWINQTGSGLQPKDYNFDLVYTDEICSPQIVEATDLFKDDIASKYEAPKIATANTFVEFLIRNLQYPHGARRNGIEGKVVCTYELTEEGTIENIRVLQGVHLLLDKEAVRVLRKLTFTTPPKVNGEPVSLCGTATVSFKMAR